MTVFCLVSFYLEKRLGVFWHFLGLNKDVKQQQNDKTAVSHNMAKLVNSKLTDFLFISTENFLS